MATVVDPVKQAELAKALYVAAQGKKLGGLIKYGISTELSNTLAYDLLRVVGEAADYRGAVSQSWITRDATQKAGAILGPVAVASVGIAIGLAVGIAGIASPKRRWI